MSRILLDIFVVLSSVFLGMAFCCLYHPDHQQRDGPQECAP